MVALVNRRPPLFRYGSGLYYAPVGAQTCAAGTAAAAGTLRLTPGAFESSCTISAIVLRLGTTAAGGLFQASIYNSDPTTGLPTGAPLYTSASTATDGAALKEIASVNLAVSRGKYWLAVQVDATGATAVFLSSATSGNGFAQMGGANAVTNLVNSANIPVGYTKAGSFGTWPTLTGDHAADSLTLATSTTCPAWAFKVA